MEDQPLPVDASPIALSPGYIADSDPEKDEEDPEEDPADYPADRGDNDDNESSDDDDNDNESSDDDDDDDDFKKDEEEEKEEEHLALADPCVEMMTTVNQGMSVEEIERVIAQRVANVIEAIAIYETKTNIALKTPTAARNQRTLTCYKCGSLGHYKSNYPIVRFQNRVDMYGKGKAYEDSSTTMSNINT
ncbi:hypothetical protein Tco_0918937 [Tanacetum coccineum]